MAVYMSRVFNCGFQPIHAERKTGILKKLFFKLGGGGLPTIVKNFLRLVEFRSGTHRRNSERHVTFSLSMTEAEKENIRTILVIDDSVDTGASLRSVVDKVKETFPASKVYTYALNVFSESENVIKTDFFTFKDRMIRTPMSQDAEEYSDFLDMCRDYGLIDGKK